MASKVMRFAVAAILALSILVVGGMGLALLAFNPNQYKSALITAVKDRYHRTLVLPGTVQVSLFPPFTLDTGPVRLSEPGSENLFARASDVRLHLNLLALLQRKIVVDGIELEGPDLTLWRNAHGQFNFADLISEANAAHGASKLRNVAPYVRFAVRDIRATGGHVALSDERSGIRGYLKNLDLHLAGLGRPNTAPLHLSAQAVFAKPVLDADVSLRGSLHASSSGPVELQDAILRSDGDMLGIQKLLGNASGDIIYTRASGAAPASLRVEGLSIRAQGQDNQGQPVQFESALPLLTWTPGRIDTTAITARALIGAAPETTRMEIHAPPASGPAHALILSGLNFDIEQGNRVHAPGLKAHLSGNLSLNLPAMSAALDTPDLQGRWRAQQANAKPLPFALQCHVAYALPTASTNFQLSGQVAHSQVAISGSSQHGALSLHVTADRLDLDSLLQAQATPHSGASVEISQSAANQPQEGSLLESLPWKATLQLGSLRFGGTQWDSVNAQLHDDGAGTLSLSSLSMQGYGGTVAGSALINLHERRISMTQEMHNVQVRPIVRALLGKGFLEGAANASLNLSAHGFSSAHWLDSLNGTVDVALSNGVLRGLSLEHSLRQAQDPLRSAQDSLATASADLQTPFAVSSAHFTIANGVAQASEITLQSPVVDAAGKGVINFPAQTLDVVLNSRMHDKPPRGRGAHQAAVQEMRVPLRISGSFAQPQYALLWSKVASSSSSAPVGAYRGGGQMEHVRFDATKPRQGQAKSPASMR